jgi:hypothetical protein
VAVRTKQALARQALALSLIVSPSPAFAQALPHSHQIGYFRACLSKEQVYRSPDNGYLYYCDETQLTDAQRAELEAAREARRAARPEGTERARQARAREEAQEQRQRRLRAEAEGRKAARGEGSEREHPRQSVDTAKPPEQTPRPAAALESQRLVEDYHACVERQPACDPWDYAPRFTTSFQARPRPYWRYDHRVGPTPRSKRDPLQCFFDPLTCGFEPLTISDQAAIAVYQVSRPRLPE